MKCFAFILTDNLASTGQKKRKKETRSKGIDICLFKSQNIPQDCIKNWQIRFQLRMIPEQLLYCELLSSLRWSVLFLFCQLSCSINIERLCRGGSTGVRRLCFWCTQPACPRQTLYRLVPQRGLFHSVSQNPKH